MPAMHYRVSETTASLKPDRVLNKDKTKLFTIGLGPVMQNGLFSLYKSAGSGFVGYWKKLRFGLVSTIFFEIFLLHAR